mmetsp:Transcript_5732/g.9831  ORF Transcript_5732/g.9831 Transcript_5732/m.9831 type:complete len:360 (+) Transcript_5732:595-1674(+)
MQPIESFQSLASQEPQVRRSLQVTPSNETQGSEGNSTDENSAADEYDPDMDPNVMPDISIQFLDEKYPEPADSTLTSMTCQNGAKYVKQTQNYYLCFSKFDDQEVYRVTNQTFVDIQKYPYYTERVDCRETQVERDVCYCPSGYVGSLCQLQDYTKCYVNVTEPALSAGCKNREADSDYYVYSINGFAPCHYFDFEKAYTFKFKLDCRPVTSLDVVKENGHQEGVQYEYNDVVVPAVLPVGEAFEYSALNLRTGLRILKDATVRVTFDFRDFKFLSNLIKFQTDVTDSEVISGLKEGEIEVDLGKLSASDRENGSKFENGGRVYFEASAFSSGFKSFSTNAFLDMEGYEEPIRVGIRLQ